MLISRLINLRVSIKFMQCLKWNNIKLLLNYLWAYNIYDIK